MTLPCASVVPNLCVCMCVRMRVCGGASALHSIFSRPAPPLSALALCPGPSSMAPCRRRFTPSRVSESSRISVTTTPSPDTFILSFYAGQG